MKKALKLWLVIGVLLVLIGGAVFGGVMMVLKWDFAKLKS